MLLYIITRKGKKRRRKGKRRKKNRNKNSRFSLFFFFYCRENFSRFLYSSLIFMHFPHHRSSRETINDVSRSTKPDRDVGLSFLYHSNRTASRLSYPSFPTYYSLAYVHMPYLSKNNNRSMQANFQIILYNFLERPTGFKCFIYHFTVYVSNRLENSLALLLLLFYLIMFDTLSNLDF